MAIEEAIQKNFKKLSRGLMQPSYPVAFEAHKNLYEIGQPVIPILKDEDGRAVFCALDNLWLFPKCARLTFTGLLIARHLCPGVIC